MLIRCPNCCREYEFDIGKDVVEFGFTCPNCKSELVVTDNKETVLHSQFNRPQPTSYTVQVQSTNSQRKSGSLKKFFLFIVIVVILLIFTCPDSRTHKDKIQSVVTSAIDDKLGEQDNELLKTIGIMISTKFVEMAITDKVTVENYLLFSIGYHYNNGERQIVSFGILNHVFTISEEQVRNRIVNSIRDDQSTDSFSK
jgi:hypothetical protein